jgi:predicted DNA-binding WGR domain protein
MKKYLEFKDAAKNSSKFWQIEIKSKKVTIQFGRIGIVNPAMLIKEFKSIEDAKKYSDTVIREKMGKGYKEK